MTADFVLNHNSHIVVGDQETVLAFLTPTLSKLIPAHLWASHPDVWQASFEQFKVDDSRLLKNRVLQRPFAGEVKIFLLQMEVITPEAQNALLKVLEEPQGDAYIFLIVRQAEIFLETVKSRCVIIYPSQTKDDEQVIKQAQDFLTATLVKRINFINDLHTKKELTKAFFITFFLALKSEAMKQNRLASAKVFIEIEKHLYDKSFLPKLALEYLAVSL